MHYDRKWWACLWRVARNGRLLHAIDQVVCRELHTRTFGNAWDVEPEPNTADELARLDLYRKRQEAARALRNGDF